MLLLAQKTKERGILFMVYSDVVNEKKVLPKKAKYTKKDFNNLIKAGATAKNARFICICSAVYYDVEYSYFFNSLECYKLCRML